MYIYPYKVCVYIYILLKMEGGSFRGIRTWVHSPARPLSRFVVLASHVALSLSVLLCCPGLAAAVPHQTARRTQWLCCGLGISCIASTADKGMMIVTMRLPWFLCCAWDAAGPPHVHGNPGPWGPQGVVVLSHPGLNGPSFWCVFGFDGRVSHGVGVWVYCLGTQCLQSHCPREHPEAPGDTDICPKQSRSSTSEAGHRQGAVSQLFAWRSPAPFPHPRLQPPLDSGHASCWMSPL